MTKVDYLKISIRFITNTDLFVINYPTLFQIEFEVVLLQ